MHKLLILFIFAFLSLCVQAQNYWLGGRIPSRYFSDKDFGTSPQILTGDQGTGGMVFFGNNQQIIGFNGTDWFKVGIERQQLAPEQYTIVRNSVVQCIRTASNGITYVGRDNNFGKIAYSDSGFIRYIPLHTGNAKNNFGLVRDLYETKAGTVLVLAQHGIFRIKKEKTEVLSYPLRSAENYVLSGSVRTEKGVIIILKAKKTAGNDFISFYYENASGTIRQLDLPGHINLQNPRGSVVIGSKTYIFGLNHKIYTLSENGDTLTWNEAETSLFPELSDYTVLSVARKDKYIFIGTDAHGLLVLNEKGEILRHFDLEDGLQNMTVNSLFHDSENNLWLCLDNGIHFIELSSPVSAYEKDKGITANVQSLAMYKKHILAATTTDLAISTTDGENRYFKNTPVFGEALFHIKSFNTSLGIRYLVVGYNGVYEYFPETNTRKLITAAYGWKLFQSPRNPDVIYLGLDSGLGEIRVSAKGFEYRELLTGMGGDVIQITGDKKYLYFGVHSKGVCIYDLDTGESRIVALGSGHGSKSYYYCELFNGKLFVGCISGIYTLNEGRTKLEPFEAVNGHFQGGEDFQIHRLVNENNKRLWIIFHDSQDAQSYKETGYLENGQSGYTWTSWPFVGLRQAGISNDLFFTGEGEILFAGLNGVYVYRKDHQLSPSRTFPVLIDAIQVNGKTICGNPEFAPKIGDIPYKNNSLKVIFHAATFNGSGRVEYAYKLSGFTEDWSEYSEVNYASFPKLPEGNYQLSVRARNIYGFVSEVSVMDFTILPPWYRTWWAYTLYAIVLIILVYLIIRISTQRIIHQNTRLEAVVLERTREIAEQNTLLERQKSEITLKSNDILDSIKYAKRIQDTILPSESRLSELFREHFVFYRPKDIVSGDFYWAREADGLRYFSAVDCTGHGVPGSLVSIVGNNGLLRAVNEFGVREPKDILDKLREIVVDAFRSQGQAEVKDGMDIALCCIDPKTNKLTYAGANNECVIIRAGEIFELSPDKQPIGQFTHHKPFRQQEFDLESGDCIYLFTDGYVDQFGGEKEKKYKSRSFKNMLIRISHLPMSEQYAFIQREFDSWKGELEQVDDVCVFGVKI